MAFLLSFVLIGVQYILLAKNEQKVFMCTCAYVHVQKKIKVCCETTCFSWINVKKFRAHKNF